MVRSLPRGIYVPTPAVFDKTEELDLATVRRHAVRLAKAGVKGLCVQGSNGEAVHLLHEERSKVTRATRQALDEAGFLSTPVIVGCGAQSVFETVKLCKDAAADGGDYAMVLSPCYYHAQHTHTTQLEFFTAVADDSPLPIIIYSYPGVTKPVDINSDTLIALSKHKNIIGCKFTCGNMGKLGRVATAARKNGDDFYCWAGSTDFCLASLAQGSHGVISGTANISPRANAKLWELAEQGKKEEAQELQGILGEGDWEVAIKNGVPGTKDVLRHEYGYGGYPRRPLARSSDAQSASLAESVRKMLDFERGLPDVA